MLIEVNDIGGQIADVMHEEFEYENIIQTTMMGRAGQKVSLGFGRGTKQRGVRTSAAVKKLGCAVRRFSKGHRQESYHFKNIFNTIIKIFIFD